MNTGRNNPHNAWLPTSTTPASPFICQGDIWLFQITEAWKTQVSHASAVPACNDSDNTLPKTMQRALKTHATVFWLFEEDVPESTVTFPLKKYFPWPLERATPTLEENGKTKRRRATWATPPVSPFFAKSWPDMHSRTAARAPPERCPFDVSVVVVVVHLQNAPLQEKKRRKSWRQALVRQGDAGAVEAASPLCPPSSSPPWRKSLFSGSPSHYAAEKVERPRVIAVVVCVHDHQHTYFWILTNM